MSQPPTHLDTRNTLKNIRAPPPPTHTTATHVVAVVLYVASHDGGGVGGRAVDSATVAWGCGCVGALVVRVVCTVFPIPQHGQCSRKRVPAPSQGGADSILMERARGAEDEPHRTSAGQWQVRFWLLAWLLGCLSYPAATTACYRQSRCTCAGTQLGNSHHHQTSHACIVQGRTCGRRQGQ